MDEGEAPAVRLRLANGEVFEHEGRVETIEADFNNETGNIAFRATFPNPDGLLRHGETGKILQATALDDVLLVPQKATFDVLDRKYVFVVDAEDTVRQREITVVEELPHLYVLGEGLSADDRILLEGLRKVRDGQHVGAELQEPAEVLASLDLHAE
jgi:membrane fusion protein (multidrug efflux system)